VKTVSRSAHIGLVRGEIYFLDGSLLHIREFVNVEHGVERYTYAYHYQRADSSLVFRYDDTPHFPDLPSFPHHKHEHSEANVMPSTPQDLEAVLAEIHHLVAASTL
jgi:hypothetical protein